jgi:hypothetical protein
VSRTGATFTRLMNRLRFSWYALTISFGALMGFCNIMIFTKRCAVISWWITERVKKAPVRLTGLLFCAMSHCRGDYRLPKLNGSAKWSGSNVASIVKVPIRPFIKQIILVDRPFEPIDEPWESVATSGIFAYDFPPRPTTIATNLSQPLLIDEPCESVATYISRT